MLRAVPWGSAGLEDKIDRQQVIVAELQVKLRAGMTELPKRCDPLEQPLVEHVPNVFDAGVTAIAV